MRALRLTAWQHEPELLEVDDPSPGPGEVLVRVGGAGACHSDLHLTHDFPAGLLPFDAPFTLGHENAGWVEAVGAGVAGLEPGQPVAVYGAWGCGRCGRCLLGMDNYCENRAEFTREGGGLGFDGGMAPLLLVPSARHCIPLTDLTPVEAAPLTDAGLTPYHAIKRSLHQLVPGSHTVVIGAGGLGHMAIQILTALSATRIIALDQSPEALHLAQAVGADEAVLAGETATAEIRELTGGQGADLVLDIVGVDATIALAISVARRLGDVTIIGVAGGTYPYGFFTVPYEVSLTTTYWGSMPELREVVALAEAGRIRAHIEQFSLDDAPQAYERMAAGTLRGRAVIVPEGAAMLERFRLDGKVAIITGAGRGIGAATALGLAEAGADVVLASRTAEQLESVAVQARDLGRRAVVAPTDVVDNEAVESLAATAIDELGRIDIVVNNAGGTMPRPFMDTSAGYLERAFHFNTTSAFVLSKAAVPHMLEQGEGAIVNISSAIGRLRDRGFVAYGTAKAALTHMTRLMAADLAPKIRVNAIAVGSIATSALEVVLTDDAIRDEMVGGTPLKRLGEADDIALCALYLASPAASFVTGKLFEVDGGLEEANLALNLPDL